MKKSIYIIAHGFDAITIANGLKDALLKMGKSAVVYNPITFNDNELRNNFSSGNYNLVIEQAIENYGNAVAEGDIAIAHGISDNSKDGYFSTKVNIDLISNLSSGAIVVASKEQIELLVTMIKEKRGDVIYTADNPAISKEMIDAVLAFETDKTSVKMFEAKMIAMAKTHKQRIVLPEGNSERVMRAAEILVKRGICDPILLGNKEELLAMADRLRVSLDGIQLEEIETNPKFEDYASTLAELRKAKGLTLEKARELMKDCGYFGTMMIYKDDADGMVSGAEHTTAHTIRPALQFIKTKPGISVVSGSFVMVFKHRYFVFADSGVTPTPTTDQLAEIALSSVETAKAVGLDPKISFMSFSTGDSSTDKAVEVTKEAMNKAIALAEKLGVKVDIDGPMQFDAAFSEQVAKSKMPNSKVAGKANIYIFPDLNCGNNCYKACQRAAEESLALGPILQGLKKPVNDLSRGCNVADIINLVSITAIQAQINKGLI